MKQATIKNIKIGGGAPISIQSMTNLSVLDIDTTLEQIKALEGAGCDIVRIALPNTQSVDAFKLVRTKTDIPLVADIHFDYRLAIGGIEAGADKRQPPVHPRCDDRHPGLHQRLAGDHNGKRQRTHQRPAAGYGLYRHL